MDQMTDPRSRSTSGATPIPLGYAALGVSGAVLGTYNAGQAHTLSLSGLPLLVDGILLTISAILASAKRGIYARAARTMAGTRLRGTRAV